MSRKFVANSEFIFAEILKVKVKRNAKTQELSKILNYEYDSLIRYVNKISFLTYVLCHSNKKRCIYQKHSFPEIRKH